MDKLKIIFWMKVMDVVLSISFVSGLGLVAYIIYHFKFCVP